MQLLIRVYNVSLSSSTSRTHQQVAKWTFPIIRASMVRAEVFEHLAGTSSIKKSLFTLRRIRYASLYIPEQFAYTRTDMLLCIHSLHIPGWPFSPISIHTTTTITATTSTCNNDNDPNMRNGSFDNRGMYRT